MGCSEDVDGLTVDQDRDEHGRTYPSVRDTHQVRVAAIQDVPLPVYKVEQPPPHRGGRWDLMWQVARVL